MYHNIKYIILYFYDYTAVQNITFTYCYCYNIEFKYSIFLNANILFY